MAKGTTVSSDFGDYNLHYIFISNGNQNLRYRIHINTYEINTFVRLGQ